MIVQDTENGIECVWVKDGRWATQTFRPYELITLVNHLENKATTEDHRL